MVDQFSLFIEIPRLTKSLNANYSKHWRTRNNENKAWYQEIFLITRQSRPEKPLQKARIELTRFTSHILLDADNLVAGFKPILDGLKRAGIIIDDSWQVIGMPKYDQRKVKTKKECKITIKVLQI